LFQRGVGTKLKHRIVSWFGYIWSQKQTSREEDILDFLPIKLKTELAMQVHLETLKRVKIFQDCDPGLLVELVLKLRLQVKFRFTRRDRKKERKKKIERKKNI